MARGLQLRDGEIYAIYVICNFEEIRVCAPLCGYSNEERTQLFKDLRAAVPARACFRNFKTFPGKLSCDFRKVVSQASLTILGHRWQRTHEDRSNGLKAHCPKSQSDQERCRESPKGVPYRRNLSKKTKGSLFRRADQSLIQTRWTVCFEF